MAPMPMPVTRPPNCLQRLVDDELVVLEKRVLQLKSKRNEYADISKFPNEILLEIFTILKDTSPVKSWFKINLVCRHWRHVAVEAPGLWSNPPTSRHELTMVMLERSKMCDLHVELDDTTSTATTTAVLNHVGRIRSLTVDQNPTKLKRTKPLLKSSGWASRLDRLIILCSRSNPQLAFSADEIQPLSQLRSLEISNIRFDWNIFPLPNLTSLSFTNVTLPASLSCDKFLETMRCMPFLQKILLDVAVLSINNPRIVPQDTVELPRLSSLAVHGATPSQLEYILSRLTLPQLQHLNVSCHIDLNQSAKDNHDFLPCMQVISKTLMDGDFGIFDLLKIVDTYFQLKPSRATSTPAGLDLSLSYVMAAHSHVFRDALTGFSPKILESVAHLDMIGTYNFKLSDPNQLFSSFFGGLPSLTSIRVDGDLAEAMIESLSTPTDHSSSTASILFRKLEEVTFHVTPLTRSMSERLHRYLKIRCASGAPISKLVLESCPIEREELDLLKAAGSEVISIDIYRYSSSEEQSSDDVDQLEVSSDTDSDFGLDE